MIFDGLNSAALLALAAAFSWTMAALFSHRPATELGSLHFNRLRMIAAVIIAAFMLLATGRHMAIGGEFWPHIILSSLTGIVFGDFFLFAAMRRVGPRRTNVLFATNALFAAVFGWSFFGEALDGQTFLAILFGFCGVVLAVIYGKRRDLMHQWEAVTPPLWIGVMLGLFAAVCQALGVIFIRPAMAAGVDPVAATLARAAVGAAVFWMTWPFDKRRRGKPLIPDWSLLLLIVLNGVFGLGIGAAFLLAALETGNVATVTILASTTPVLILPFIWFKTRMMPAPGAWAGACLVVVCTTLLSLDP